MIAERSHKKNDGKRRGDIHPARLRIDSRRGVTLVELMISMLILTIVCLAWLEIIGIQSARKEARRREAVERLAGMMDAFMYMSMNGKINGKAVAKDKCYTVMNVNSNGVEMIIVEPSSDGTIQAMFNGDVSPIGYQLRVVAKSKLDDYDKFIGDWNSAHKWLVGKLYNRSNCSESEAGKPFFTLPVCLGF